MSRLREISIASASERLATADRVLVVGCSGSGKTTLARKISDRFSLEHISLDRDVIWLPGWQVRARDDQRARLSALVCKNRWIIDGNSPATLDLRVARADLILWLRLPRWVALMGLAKRIFTYYGTVRPGIAEGCPERFPDLEFLSYIWTFEQKMAPRIEGVIREHQPNVPVAILRSRADTKALFRERSPVDCP
ncbi:MAG: AAA family ATPase [Pseudomonadota bacterium]